MKVNSQGQISQKKSLSKKDAIKERLKAKFGKSFKGAKEKNIEISKKAKAKDKKNSEIEDSFKSDIGQNNPESQVTQEKLKSLLRSGAFQFNDAERRALGEILDV
ncbi:MAG: hypothetical protein N4A33_06625 [Bacteriovoracaceae bacterium]|jgi:hypothetical protein|nr:hypothetical protein [Bacteriovoracaceae bacterium]